jgi:hypothetical protein
MGGREIMDGREKRQYFEDLYVMFLGSNIKNGHSQNPSDIIKVTELHFNALIKRLKEIKDDEI